MRHGLVFVPLDSHMPLEKISAAIAPIRGAPICRFNPHFLSDSFGAVCILAEQDSMLSRSIFPSLPLLLLAHLTLTLLPPVPPSTGALPCPVLGPSPAYIMFTSGSTGPSQLVIVPHQAAAPNVKDIVERLQLDSTCSMALIAPPGFGKASLG